MNRDGKLTSLHKLDDVPQKKPLTELTAAATNRNRVLPPKMVLCDAGWSWIQKEGIDKLREMLEQRAKSGSKKDLVFPRQQAVEVCTKIFVMCNQPDPYNWSKDLYTRHGKTIEEYLSVVALPGLKQARNKSQDPSAFFTAFLDIWDDYVFFSKWMTNFFHILDRIYAEPNNLSTAEKTSLIKFEKMVFQPYQPKLLQCVLFLIKSDRNGDYEGDMDISLVIDTAVVYKKMDSVAMKYSEHLEEKMLSATRQYYKDRHHDWRYLDGNDYQAQVYDAIEEEKLRHDDYLHAISPVGAKISCLVFEELLEIAPNARLDSRDGGKTQSSSSCTNLLPVLCLFASRKEKHVKKTNKENKPKATDSKTVK